jgi:ABC-2 type transport system ATP-binding protein
MATNTNRLIREADHGTEAEAGRYHHQVVISDVTKQYGAHQVLTGVTLSIREGEVFGLLGPNGAGKTTLVEIMEGLRRPTTGTVAVLGLDPQRQTAQLKERIGVCLQATSLHDKIRVSEVMELFASTYRNPLPSENLLKRFGLWDSRRKLVNELSGGQRQRLVIAIGVINEPDLLFLDEPTTGLDAHSRIEVHGIISDLKRQGKTIVLTTHYLEEAERLCDRVGILHKGTILCCGSPFEVRKRGHVYSELEFELDGALPDSAIASIKAYCEEIQAIHRTVIIRTQRPGDCVLELSRQVLLAHLRIVDMQLRRPSLEDAFINMTSTDDVS